MIDQKGDPYVVEFNVRFGDPECQVTMPLLGDHALDWFTAVANDELASVTYGLEESAADGGARERGYPERGDRTQHRRTGRG